MKRAVGVAVAATLAVAPNAGAVQRLGVLPSPTAAIRASPPLPAPPGLALLEQRIPGRVRASEHVRVGVDERGAPIRVVVVHRLLVTRKGDYSFVVPGPIEDAVPAAGSASDPGLRAGAVVWQGFSPRRRQLAAAITLDPVAAARGLPVRVSIDDTGVLIANATRAVAVGLAAPARASAVAGALDEARSLVRRTLPVTAQTVPILAEQRTENVRVAVPLRIQGTIRFASGRPRVVRVATTLEGDRIRIRSGGQVRGLDLTIVPLEPVETLRPPAGSTWRAFVQARRPRTLPFTRLAVRRLLQAALARQYHAYLANPDPSGRARTTYAFRLAAQTTTPKVAPTEDGSGAVWPRALIVAALALATLGAVVLWAHA